MEFHAPLPDNYKLSVDRLHGLLFRLKQDLAIFKEYDNIIQDQLGRGIIETVPQQMKLLRRLSTIYSTMLLCAETRPQRRCT